MGDHNLQGQQTHTGASVFTPIYGVFPPAIFPLFPSLCLQNCSRSAFGRRSCGKSRTQEVLTEQDTGAAFRFSPWAFGGNRALYVQLVFIPGSICAVNMNSALWLWVPVLNAPDSNVWHVQGTFRSENTSGSQPVFLHSLCMFVHAYIV